MRKLGLFALLSILAGFLVLSGCDNGDDPQPVSLVFSLNEATFNGNPVSPLPTYNITINFDADGNPDGYSATGNATYTPTPGPGSGTFTVSGNTATFTAQGGDQRSVTITGGSITPSSVSATVQWELTKVDDGVPFEDAGTYEYTLQVQ